VVSGDQIHQAAASGFQNAADRYERGRPGYPADAVALLTEVLGIGPGRTVLDLGAGTGKFTRSIADRGATVIAVEPVAAMRATLREVIPAATILNGIAEAIPLADGAVDAVVVAQAFHWFDADRALQEIHRVLRPGGALGLIWNVRDESSAWSRRLTQLFDELSGSHAPRYKHGTWRVAFEATERFEPLRSRTIAHDHLVTREGFIDRVASVSYVAAAPDGERSRVLSEVRELLDTDPDLAGHEVIAMPYRTEVFWTERRERPQASATSA
jgi:ubiquinone/menaquinone biosynthesis C-methylase UbiE